MRIFIRLGTLFLPYPITDPSLLDRVLPSRALHRFVAMELLVPSLLVDLELLLTTQTSRRGSATDRLALPPVRPGRRRNLLHSLSTPTPLRSSSRSERASFDLEERRLVDMLRLRLRELPIVFEVRCR